MSKLQEPQPPKVSTELIKKFFKQARSFYDSKPWDHITDADLFGIVVPDTQEIHMVTVMGAGGECFGIATYRGIWGLEFYNSVSAGDFELDPASARRHQDGLLMEFVNKKYLDKFDKELVKQGQYIAPDAKSSILLRDMAPGWMPWGLQDKDLLALISVMEVVPQVIEYQMEDDEWTFSDNKGRFPIFVYNKKKQLWDIRWWSEDQIAKASEKIEITAPHLTPTDELTIHKLKQLEIANGVEWELYTFFSDLPAIDKSRPFFPEFAAVLDKKAGFCFGTDTFSPNEHRASVARDVAVDAMLKHKVIPSVIWADRIELLAGVFTLKEALGIDLKLGPSSFGHELEEGMRNFQ